MFTSLKRIVYHVDDLDAARDWYAGILGRQPVFQAPFAVIFTVGECSLSLAKDPASGVEPPPRMEVYWEVEDVDATFDRLVAAGATIRTAVRDVLNVRVAQVTDPFGNVIGITGPPPDVHERTVAHKPSATAMTAAFCRALAARDDREGIRGPDTFAEIFLTNEGKKPLHDVASREWAIKNLVTSPLYGYFIARTAYFDGVFRRALAEGVGQVVLLGAGYDMRAWRFEKQLGARRVFELDIRSTQESKIAALRAAKIEIPPQVTFVCIDFKVDELGDVLARTGFDPSVKTLFLWEGVTYYLTDEAVNATLRFVRSNSPQGSMLCMDFLTEKLGSVNPAEPFLFWKDPRQIGEMLIGHGFRVLEMLDATEMERRYLTLADGSLGERTLPLFRFVFADSMEDIR